jgi:hypothetical protein
MTLEPNAPPPWDLTGSGYIFLYRLPREMAEQYVPFGIYKGGFSVLMLVDYATTNVGPYKEALFIPGVIEYPQASGYSIGKIYVSTMASVVNGIHNWAIPKELASFTFDMIDPHTERITVSEGEKPPYLEMVVNAGGLRFPITGAIMPSAVQHREGKSYVTRIGAKGRAQFAQVMQIRTQGDAFPPLEHFSPLIALRVTDFSMVFPIPKVY